tara:strand:- start:9 stop:179 length:171 start_codon:yes stop_codon:yes gene_type:complete
VIVLKIEFTPFVPAVPDGGDAGLEVPIPAEPPAPTVIGKAVAVTEIFPAPSKGEAV